MAEGLAGLGVAASVLQVIDFGTRFIVKAWKIYSTDFAETLVSDLQRSSTNLHNVLHELQSISANDASEKAIRSLAGKSAAILKELLDSLAVISRAGEGRRRGAALKKAFLMAWKEDELRSLQVRLNEVKSDLILPVNLSLMTHATKTLDKQDQIIEEMRKMRADIQGLTDTSSNSMPASIGYGSQVVEHLTRGLEERDEIKSYLLRALISNIYKSEILSDATTAASIQLSKERRWNLQHKFIQKLHYDTMQERESIIEEAHEGTFHWVFGDQQSEYTSASSFKSWLESDEQLYWITGKAGSGKSTLMRFISRPVPPTADQVDHETKLLGKTRPRCETYLQRWAGSEQKLVIASFYFWAIGQKPQTSQKGLFCTLLYQLLKACPEVIPMIAPSRWESLCLFDEAPKRFSEEELGDMFRQAVAHISSRAKVVLFVDGLDEFDGDCNILISLFKECASSPIKICVSSRPWTEFEDAFGSCPSLRMEDVTYQDITNYVVDKFGTSHHFQRLQRRQTDVANELIQSVVQRASGVFLWVTIVVASLIAGMGAGDRIEDLEKRLNLLPTELKGLYERILDGIDPLYRQHTAQLFKMMTSCIALPPLLAFWFADETDFMERALRENPDTLPEYEVLERQEDMRRRLNSRCRGLLDVDTDLPNPQFGGTVRYLHKTVVEFIQSPSGKELMNKHLDSSFDADIRLAAAQVALLKIKIGWRTANKMEDTSLFQPYVSHCLAYVGRASPESSGDVMQLMDKLRDECKRSDKTLKGWDKSRAIARNALLGKPRQKGEQRTPGFIDLTPDEHFLCLATQGLVLQYTQARATKGCLLIGEPANAMPSNKSQPVSWSYHRLLGRPDGPALSLLSLPSVRDYRSVAMLEFLLDSGAKPNVEIDRIRGLLVDRATPWEEILAKAIRALDKGVGDEARKNASNCVRLMVDRGAKVSESAVSSAFKLANESRTCETLDEEHLLSSRLDFSGPSDVYGGFSQRSVYQALKAMKKNPDMGFKLQYVAY
ncbi:hypothetical protein NM208_g12674 [Fusarium decemcellulare]|uniref:Uncharacterized protein n=1 Tax=Fusarium decemcellulare TaxID=57161 RepID=A0ACC1RQG6_9HYPO|nr:hypothetical protein NM208_g12674 [Fusarium decemcellulare]